MMKCKRETLNGCDYEYVFKNKSITKGRAMSNKLMNSQRILHDVLQTQFEDALQKKYPRLRRAYSKGTGINIGSDPPEYSLSIVDSPTDRVLNKLRVKQKKKEIMLKLEEINQHYRVYFII